jgi:hypothetical protein
MKRCARTEQREMEEKSASAAKKPYSKPIIKVYGSARSGQWLQRAYSEWSRGTKGDPDPLGR